MFPKTWYRCTITRLYKCLILYNSLDRILDAIYQLSFWHRSLFLSLQDMQNDYIIPCIPYWYKIHLAIWRIASSLAADLPHKDTVNITKTIYAHDRNLHYYENVSCLQLSKWQGVIQKRQVQSCFGDKPVECSNFLKRRSINRRFWRSKDQALWVYARPRARYFAVRKLTERGGRLGLMIKLKLSPRNNGSQNHAVDNYVHHGCTLTKPTLM